ncbi:hypothetical protein ALC53_00409, partial [Atta colombica]
SKLNDIRRYFPNVTSKRKTRKNIRNIFRFVFENSIFLRVKWKIYFTTNDELRDIDRNRDEETISEPGLEKPVLSRLVDVDMAR